MEEKIMLAHLLKNFRICKSENTVSNIFERSGQDALISEPHRVGWRSDCVPYKSYGAIRETLIVIKYWFIYLNYLEQCEISNGKST